MDIDRVLLAVELAVISSSLKRALTHLQEGTIWQSETDRRGLFNT